MNRVVLALAATIGIAGVFAYGDPDLVAQAKIAVSGMISSKHSTEVRNARVDRSRGGEFALKVAINGAHVPMVIDTGATSVVLTYEAAKAAGMPLELLDYNVEVETAGGKARAARLTLDRLAIGQLVERSVPALVVPRGQLKTSLLGMSFLNRLESWEVNADRLLLRGYP